MNDGNASSEEGNGADEEGNGSAGVEGNGSGAEGRFWRRRCFRRRRGFTRGKRWLRPGRQSHLFNGLLCLRSKNECEEDCRYECRRSAGNQAGDFGSGGAAERAEKGAKR